MFQLYSELPQANFHSMFNENEFNLHIEILGNTLDGFDQLAYF